MLLIQTTRDLSEALLIKSVLESQNVRSEIRNEYFSGMPNLGTEWPEVWILNDVDASKAQQIIKEDFNQ